MLYTILRILTIIVFKIIFRFEVFGKKFIPKKGGFILASNHVSYLDPVTLGVTCPRKLNFMAKYDLFSNRLFSWLISMLGAFPVKRYDSWDISAIREAMRRLKNGNGLVLFPQGRRMTSGNTSNQPQPGVGFLASKLNVPIIPAFIKGTERALPKGAKFIYPGKISVYFGKQICIRKEQSYQDVAQLIMENIKKLNKNKGEIKNGRS